MHKFNKPKSQIIQRVQKLQEYDLEPGMYVCMHRHKNADAMCNVMKAMKVCSVWYYPS